MSEFERPDAGQLAKPFVKWPGGKTYLLPRLTDLLNNFPCESYDYCEPMVGGGAVFFHLSQRFRCSRISDVNPDLINLYRMVQQNVDDLIAELRSGRYFFTRKNDSATRENYLRIRSSNPTTEVGRAARFLFLNKTCFNGLMRVNRAGQFNAAIGSYHNPTVCDEPALRAAARALAHTTISGPEDAAQLIRRISGAKTFLLVDPPYHGQQIAEAGKNGGKFTNYSGEFGDREQSELVQVMLDSGCSFVYTNRHTDFIVNLFKGSGTQLFQQDLKHSIQPKYTTGLVECELVAFRYCPVEVADDLPGPQDRRRELFVALLRVLRSKNPDQTFLTGIERGFSPGSCDIFWDRDGQRVMLKIWPDRLILRRLVGAWHRPMTEERAFDPRARDCSGQLRDALFALGIRL
jgi:DNA adenine methylase